MREDIKERIEMIQRGEVPEGYKKTKVGIIPKDWNVVKIRECLKPVKNAVTIEENKEYKQIGIRSHGKGIFYKEQVKGKELGNKKVYWIEPDCFIVNVVFAWEQAVAKSTKNELGMIGSHRFPMYKPIDNKVLVDYLVDFFLSQKGKEVLEYASPGGAGRNRTLGQDRFMSTIIALPTIKVQKGLVSFLRQYNKKILLLEQLIVQKREQEKWLMQQFFNEKELCKFDIEIELGKLGEVFKGLYGKSKEDFGIGKPYIPYKNIYSNYIVDEKNLERVNINDGEKQVQVKYGDLFFTISSETADEIGMASVYLGKCKELYLNSFCFGYRLPDFNKMLPDYAVYYFSSDSFRKTLKVLAQGATRYNLSPKSFLKTIIRIPNIMRQKYIANILRTQTNEIELLEKKLEQVKLEKKAMMQLLLTGIVRVN